MIVKIKKTIMSLWIYCGYVADYNCPSLVGQQAKMAGSGSWADFKPYFFSIDFTDKMVYCTICDNERWLCGLTSDP